MSKRTMKVQGRMEGKGGKGGEGKKGRGHCSISLLYTKDTGHALSRGQADEHCFTHQKSIKHGRVWPSIPSRSDGHQRHLVFHPKVGITARAQTARESQPEFRMSGYAERNVGNVSRKGTTQSSVNSLLIPWQRRLRRRWEWRDGGEEGEDAFWSERLVRR